LSASQALTLVSSFEPLVPTLRRQGTLLEGPRADADGNVLFNDVLGGGAYRLTAAGEIETLVPKRRGIGGILPHAQGGIVVSGRSVVHVRDGETRELLDVDGVEGFNDISTDADGHVLAGGLRFHPFEGEDPRPGEVWRIDGPGSAEVVAEGILWPNGIGHSPDRAVMYVSDYARGQVLAFPGGDVFAESPQGSVDGLAVDVEGGVWVALADGGGVARFLPDGRLEGIADVPAGFVTSVSFGGEGRRDVYVTTADSLAEPETGGAIFRARAEVAGMPIADATV
jgi:sugar lactone lactonase YvrE